MSEKTSLIRLTRPSFIGSKDGMSGRDVGGQGLGLSPGAPRLGTAPGREPDQEADGQGDQQEDE